LAASQEVFSSMSEMIIMTIMIIRNLYSLRNIITMIKSMRMRLAGHATSIEQKRHACRILGIKPEGKRPLGRPRRR
jgi:hypothetical protein